MKSSAELQRKWAQTGAEARLKEIEAEVEEIYRIFPDLRRRTGATRTKGQAKRRFSPEGRAAIAEGMRKYWARRRAAAKAKK